MLATVPRLFGSLLIERNAMDSMATLTLSAVDINDSNVCINAIFGFGKDVSAKSKELLAYEIEKAATEWANIQKVSLVISKPREIR